ncbi:MAG: ABC transporter permease subunit [Rhodospirillaceae bacterium]|nr:ABC transporter permease subunit [Rhodospirillaceae bacterium]MCY4310767.1 ABC transporter permease subunit [Rhodospirillaceae bacterium]
MGAIAAIAGREFREGIRNRWVLGATLILTVLSVTLAFLGSTPAGTVRASPLAVTVVSLSSLSIFLVPLIALFLSFDGITGESERGTLLLLLSYPISRRTIVIGKFIGYAAIIGFSVIIGYGSAGAAVLAFQGGDGVFGYLGLIGSTVLLGMVFASLGLLVSAIFKERATAAGMSVAVWLLFALLFDMALMAALAADDNQRIGPSLVPWLLMLNPTDVYRFFNLTLLDDVRTFAGMASLGRAAMPDAGLLIAAMLLWVIIPLAAASLVFRRSDVR